MSTKNLEIKTDPFQVYNETDAAGKIVLQRVFGTEVFNQKITDRIKSFEDACSILGLTNAQVYGTNDTADEIAYKKLKVIAKALNEGWVPDWNNSNQYKYYPYFNMQGGFSFNDFVYIFTLSYVGSRLCFKSSELATYMGQQFEPLYKDLFTL